MEAVYYGRKLLKKIFPLNYSLETEILKKVLHSDNGEDKAWGALKESEADVISI